MIFKQKKGFLLRDFVIVGILFGVIISLFIIQVASVADNYNNQDIVSANFAQHYNKLQTNLASLDTSYSAVKGTGGLNLIGTFNIAFNSVFTVIIMVWDSVAIYGNMFGSLTSDFLFLDKGVIGLVGGGIVACLVAYLIFVWLSSVSRGKI
jgi:hypothetical protein